MSASTMIKIHSVIAEWTGRAVHVNPNGLMNLAPLKAALQDAGLTGFDLVENTANRMVTIVPYMRESEAKIGGIVFGR